jgi:iron complex outermembrane recepter protein
MKRYIPLSLAVAVASAAAEKPPMEHVLVTVPLHKQEAETALPVTVFSGDELRRIAATSIGETLSESPGLANASFGPGVGRPVIRGQQGARVMVLQNSTPSADVSGLSADHAVSVEPMLAESIEVLRGPSTLLYGGGAIGGVINVIDNRIPGSVPEETTGGVEYRYSSASELNSGVFKLDGGSGDWAYHLDGLYREWDNLDIPGRAANERDVETTDGYIANTDGDTKSLSGGSSYHFASGFFGMAVSRLENNYGIPPGAHGHGDDDHDHEDDHDDEHAEEHDEGHGEEEAEEVKLDVKQTRYDATLQLENPLPALEAMRSYLTYTDYGHDEIESGGEVGTRYERDTWNGRIEAVHKPVRGFHGVFGLQASNDSFSALGEEAFIPKTDSNSVGAFLVEDRHIGDWIFEGGLRYDWTQRDPDTNVTGTSSFDAFSGSLSALWQFAPEWQAGLALSISERAPTDEELYSNIEAANPSEWVVHAATNAIELGDDQLDTETSNNADLSLRWSADGDFVRLSAFYNDFTDYINLVNTGLEEDDVEVYAYIQDDANFYGAELDSEFALTPLAGGDLRLGMFGDVIYGDADSGGDIPRLPPARIGSRLAWSTETLELWTRVLYASDQDKPGDFERSTQSYTKWDVGGEYRIPMNQNELIVFFEVENIGNEQIRLSTSFLRDIAPESGISAEVGIRFLF